MSRHAAPRLGLIAALLGTVCGLAAVGLALQHPLSAALAVLAVLLLMVGAAWQPFAIPALMLALLPVAALAPYTGWMLVEEFDLLLLALLAGGWLRLAWPVGLPERQTGGVGGARGLWWLLALAYLAAASVSIFRGLTDAGAWAGGSFAWSWWHGWREPMNVLRTAKPLLWALLAWPLWQGLQARAPQRAAQAIGWGAVGGLALVSAAATWERWVWTGLTNFSSDYRTTALFWEAHIGGAALDGFLALTFPFVLWLLATARDRRVWVLGCGVAVLAGYAVLTTFSRGLYLALAVSLLLWFLLQRRVQAPSGAGAAPLLWPGLWVLGFALAAWFVFHAGGWRALAALWIWLALAFGAWQFGFAAAREGQSARKGAAGGSGPWFGLVVGLVLGGLAVGLALAAPGAWKAPYAVFVLLAAGTGVAVWFGRHIAHPAWQSCAVAGWVATGLAVVGVAWHWGETGLGWQASWAVAGLALAAGLAQAWPVARGPTGGRWRWPALAAMGLAGLVVGSVGGGAYLEGRVATVEDDWQGRLAHWQRSSALPASASDRLWGIGVGRFAAHFALSGLTTDQTGDYQWRAGDAEEAGTGQLLLTAGKHMLGFGEIFRMSQRIPVPAGPVTVRWRAFTEQPTVLHVEICSKHLLYDSGCSTGQVPLAGSAPAPQPPGWAEGEVALPAQLAWRQPVFSVAVDTRGARVRLDWLQVIDADGRDLLRNGSFERGLAHWLPSSDRVHLPWHAKNLGLHLLVEQGWVGAVLFGALLAFVAARLLLGQARRHPLAPALVAGLAGMLVVGAFDSLLDVPRLAFACLLLMGVAATLRSDAFAAGS